MGSELWAGSFGDAYLERNRVDWQERIPFWSRILQWTDAKSVLEVGSNAGWNLRAICNADPGVHVRGVDVNERALEEARSAGLPVLAASAEDVGVMWPRGFDLVFTAGVLIHVPPEDVRNAMLSIINASRKWVLAVEYSADEEQVIEYRGETAALWKRPFGKLYEELGMRIVRQGVLLKPAGFDNCHFWLLERA